MGILVVMEERYDRILKGAQVSLEDPLKLMQPP